MIFSEYIHELIKNGRICFDIQSAMTKLNKSRKAIRSSIEHLLAKGELASPSKGFYVIVPPEYQVLGCIPAEYFIPYLMDYWKCEYYACLLTAAKYYGASHQAVMVFQVMVPNSKRAINCGKVKVKFIINKNIRKSFSQRIPTRMSMLTVSTPETTAMDMMNYPDQSGGWNQIATVLTELQESMRPDKLRQLAEKSNHVVWKQRLGYLLEFLGATELAEILKDNLSKENRIDYVQLSPGGKIKKEKKDSTWKIIINTTIESDI